MWGRSKGFKPFQIALFLWLAVFPMASAMGQTYVETPRAPRPVPWDDLLDQKGGARIHFGAKLLGPAPFERNTAESFAPASNSKLFTTGLALETLSQEYRFETRLAWKTLQSDPASATELRLIGTGDPSWGMSEFNETITSRIDALVAELARKGIRKVYGPIDVQGNDPRWNFPRYPDGWEDSDKVACYGALAQAINIQLNCATLTVYGTVSGQATYRWDEPGVSMLVETAIQSGTKTQIWAEPRFDSAGRILSYLIKGTWAKGRKSPSQVAYLPISDTSGWARNLVEQSLRRARIQHLPSAPTEAVALADEAVFFSAPLREILKPFLKRSFNLMGDALFKTTGILRGPSELDLLSASQKVMRDFVNGLGMPTARHDGLVPVPGVFSGQANLVDGSGLSRQSSTTVNAMMALLTDLSSREDFKAVWDALPIAGVDGTLSSRMKNTPAAGVLRAKTGTLSGVYNLSGYVPRPNGKDAPTEYAPFVILTRTTSQYSDAAHAAEDRVGAALAAVVTGKSQEQLEASPSSELELGLQQSLRSRGLVLE